MPASGTKTVRVLQPPPDGGPPTARSLLRLLTHTTAAVLGGDDLPNQARQIARQIRRAFRVDACIIRVLDGDHLLLLASDGVPRKLLYPRMPVGWGITEELFTRREPLFIPDVRKHPLTAPTVGRLPNSYEFTSYAGAPLIANEQVIGLVGLYSQRQREPFTREELDCIQVFANNIAVAVVNHSLYREVQQQKEQLEEQIRQRSAAEETLRRSEKQVRLITDSIPLLICYVDHKMRYRFVNRAYERFWKRSPAEIEGKSVRQLLGASAFKTLRKHIEAALRGEASRVETELVLPDGIRRHIEVNYIPDVAPDGNVRGYCALVEDISERKAAEKALLESEERYRSVVEDQTEFVVRWRPDGTRTFVNESYCRYFGSTREELIGTPFMSRVAEEDREAVRRKMASFSRENPVLVDEHRAILPDGRIGWNEWTDRALFDEKGRIIEFQSVGRDITERKRLQEQLLQAQKMESIGTLAGGVAHDFGNMLAVILGNIGILKRQPGLSDKARELIADITLAAERGSAFTQQLLAYARGGEHLRQRTEINALVRSAWQIVQKKSPWRIQACLNLQPDCPAVLVNPVQIEQVIMNVCLNAVEALGGRRDGITIATQLQKLGAREATSLGLKPGDYVRLSVCDQGSGMSEATVRRMFDPFFTTKPMGRGMGLATALGIIRDNYGQIRINSAPGEGTTVLIWISTAPE